MEKIIEEILGDLYALDKDLIQYDKALRKAIEKIIESKPDTKFDENFKLRLRGELMEKVRQLKNSGEKKTFQKRFSIVLEHFSVFLGQFSQSRWALALPMLILVVGVAFFVQRQYSQNGGVYLTKQNVSFALSPTKVDPAGIEPDTSFVLKSSKDLPEATIKKTLSFKPETDFSVTKVKKTAMLALPALAAEQTNAQDLPYQYEIKTTGELEKGKVYQIAIKNDQIADRNYQWAFQVKAPFGAVESFPASHTTNVLLNTGIEVQLNRSLPEGAEKYFEISPKVEGTFEIKMDKLYFHPKGLTEKKIYTVTLKKGLTSKDDGEVLNEDYVFAFETDTKDNQSAKNGVSFWTNKKVIEATSDIHPMIDVFDNAENAKSELEVKLYALNGEDEFMQSYQASKNWDFAWSQYAKEKEVNSFKPGEDRKTFSAKGKLVTGSPVANQYFEVPENLKDGYYFFELSRGKDSDYGWIVVSKIAQYTSLAGNSGLMWAYDFPAQKPLQEAEIFFVEQNKNEQKIGKLDGGGLLNFSLPEALKTNSKNSANYGPQFFKISAPGFQSKVIIANENADQVEQGKRFWEKLSTDKNKYRPNDTINFWGVLKGRNKNIQNEKVTVELNECVWGGAVSKKLPLVSQQLSISKFDTVSGSLKLPEVGVGNYCLLIVSEDKKETYSSTSLEVATYEKPAYQLSVETFPKAVFTGQEVILKVKASFYDGTPVSKLKLKYDSEGQILNNRNISPENEFNDKTSGVLTLDENGSGEVKITPKKNEKSTVVKDYSEISFVPVMAEEGDISQQLTVDVFNSAMALDAQVEEGEKGKFEVTAKVNKIDLAKGQAEQAKNSASFPWMGDLTAYLSDPVADYKIEGQLVKITQEKIEFGEHYDYITKTQIKDYNYKQKEENVEKFDGKTDQQGQWKFTKKIENNDPMVSYKIIFSAVDQQGRKFSQEVYLYSGPSLYGQVELSINQDYFSVGDKVKLQLKEASQEDKSLDNKTLFYRYQNDIDQAVVKDGKDFEEIFEEQFAPSTKYMGVILTAYGFQESSWAIAQQKEEDKELSIEIKPEKEQYRPGEQVQAQIAIKDKAGKPVSTQVNVAVVDEALFQNDDQSSDKDLLENLYAPIYSVSPISAYTQYMDRRPGGGAGGGGEPRSVFLDVPYFQNLETDANGKAMASFTLPDNLTGWRITAKAFDTKAMTAGQTHEIISTGLPFFVDVTLNPIYLTGDSPQLKLRFFGKDYDPNQPVEFSIASKDFVIRQTGSTKDSTQYLSLGALPKGEYEIKISAKQGEKNDSLIRKIVVKDSYFEKTESRSYQVSQDLKNLKANDSGFTKIVFADKGKGKYFSTLVNNVEDGGARLDQMVAAYVSKKLLAQEYYGSKFNEDLDTESFNKDYLGLSLFTYGDANLEVSAKVADASVNSINKDALKSYFNQSLYDSKADIHRISKSLYGLASIGQPVLNKINIVKENKNELAIDDKIYLGLALAKSGDLEGARQYYENEIKGATKVDGQQAWLESGNIPIEPEKLTATLGMLAADVSDQAMLEKIWNYLDSHNPKRDLIVLEKAIIVESQLAQIPKQQASFNLKTNKRNEKISLDGQGVAIVMLAREEMDSLSFSDVKGNIEAVSVFENDAKDKLQNDASLKLTRAYKLGETQTAKFAEGDVVKITLSAQFLPGTPKGEYQIKDILPSGLKPIVNSQFDVFDFAEREKQCEVVRNPDKVDGNQIYFSFQNQCANFTVSFYARVISKGTFKADSATLQSIENLEKYFVTPTEQIEIR